MGSALSLPCGWVSEYSLEFRPKVRHFGHKFTISGIFWLKSKFRPKLENFGPLHQSSDRPKLPSVTSSNPHVFIRDIGEHFVWSKNCYFKSGSSFSISCMVVKSPRLGIHSQRGSCLFKKRVVNVDTCISYSTRPGRWRIYDKDTKDHLCTYAF